ncbi:hypothetical protein [Moraxella caviae]|nr:hypothetical protein [Moraxella caviae]
MQKNGTSPNFQGLHHGFDDDLTAGILLNGQILGDLAKFIA